MSFIDLQSEGMSIFLNLNSVDLHVCVDLDSID